MGGRAGEGLSLLYGALSSHLLGRKTFPLTLPPCLWQAVQGQLQGSSVTGELGSDGWPWGAMVLLIKGLYQAPSADVGCIIHGTRDGSPFIWGTEREGAGISHSRATRSSHQETLV